MKHLHDQMVAAEFRARLARLQPGAKAQWGRMTVAQALAHMATSLEDALGDSKPPRMFVGHIFGRLARHMALRDDAPLKRNTPTAPTLMIRDDRDFDRERRRLDALIQRFADGGETACTTHPHTFFGKMTPRDWAVLQYKHVDHHLRQFGG